MNQGKLLLIPNLISDTEISTSIPQDVVSKAIETRFFIVENIKIARRYLRKLDREFPIDKSTFFELNKHTNPEEISSFLTPIKSGHNVAIISDAGCPGIADPGAVVIEMAHEKNIEVVPFIGPSSILLALMASGLNGQNFAFNGYLSKDKTERTKELKLLESKSTHQSQVFMDTPFRNLSLLQDIINICNPNKLLCIAINITSTDEFIKTKPIKYWKDNIPELNKKPCLFIL